MPSKCEWCGGPHLYSLDTPSKNCVKYLRAENKRLKRELSECNSDFQSLAGDCKSLGNQVMQWKDRYEKLRKQVAEGWSHWLDLLLDEIEEKDWMLEALRPELTKLLSLMQREE